MGPRSGPARVGGPCGRGLRIGAGVAVAFGRGSVRPRAGSHRGVTLLAAQSRAVGDIALWRAGIAGFTVINRSSLSLAGPLQTGLAAGTYCDVVGGDLAADRAGCTGTAIAVSPDGTATFNVPPMQAFAIHIGARVGAP